MNERLLILTILVSPVLVPCQNFVPIYIPEYPASKGAEVTQLNADEIFGKRPASDLVRALFGFPLDEKFSPTLRAVSPRRGNAVGRRLDEHIFMAVRTHHETNRHERASFESRCEPIQRLLQSDDE